MARGGVVEEVRTGDRVVVADEVETHSAQIFDDVSSCKSESDIVDLYAVGYKRRKTEEGRDATPFVHVIKLHGPKGELVRVWGMFDDGTMVAAMCSRVFAKVKHRLGSYGPSKKRLQMADGKVVNAEAVWTGVIELDGVKLEGSFEVFDSGGSWSFLFGKPLILAFDAVHYYKKDEVTIVVDSMKATLRNQFDCTTDNGDSVIHYLGHGSSQQMEKLPDIDSRKGEDDDDEWFDAEEGAEDEDEGGGPHQEESTQQRRPEQERTKEM
ncbi:hypothetical protein DXG01_011297 [Tephrocybe rancida]|nr:hypothetical protein DXG01_011297 [Tephrocybe rancida]